MADNSIVPNKAERMHAADILRRSISHRTNRHQLLMTQAEIDGDFKLADLRRVSMDLEVAMSNRMTSILERDSLADDLMVG